MFESPKRKKKGNNGRSPKIFENYVLHQKFLSLIDILLAQIFQLSHQTQIILKILKNLLQKKHLKNKKSKKQKFFLN